MPQTVQQRIEDTIQRHINKYASIPAKLILDPVTYHTFCEETLKQQKLHWFFEETAETEKIPVISGGIIVPLKVATQYGPVEIYPFDGYRGTLLTADETKKYVDEDEIKRKRLAEEMKQYDLMQREMRRYQESQLKAMQETWLPLKTGQGKVSDK